MSLIGLGVQMGLFAIAPLSAQAIASLESSLASDSNHLSDEPVNGQSQGSFAFCAVRSPHLQQLTQRLTQQTGAVVNWIEQPDRQIDTALQRWGPWLLASLSPTPWPAIHERARLAQVPILMYHDILPEKEVFFDVTPEEFEQHLQKIRDNGLTPISLDQLVLHLRTGMPLPEKPILLSFDDGYRGHYEYVFPLLKQYGYPGAFSIYTYKVGRDHGRPSFNWAQLQEMAAHPLVTITAHSVSHPSDLRELTDEELWAEVMTSKQELEQSLGIPIRYFTYPEGHYDARVANFVQEAGYVAALTMDNAEDRFVGASPHLLAMDRMGQSQIDRAIAEAWGGLPLPSWTQAFDFTSPIRMTESEDEDLSLTLIAGGKPVTIHADSRYAVEDIIADTDVKAAVDGGFFSMEYLDSNVMIGPVLSRSTRQFVPGNASENLKLNGRPLVLMNEHQVQFIPFDAAQHNTLTGIQAEMEDVTDAFVAAAWLVKDGDARHPESFGGLFDFDAERHRAFWGINQAGQPTIGITHTRIDSIRLGQRLVRLGLKDVVMLDSGGSTALAFEGQSLVRNYEPRPVPHVVGLVPNEPTGRLVDTCAIATRPDRARPNRP